MAAQGTERRPESDGKIKQNGTHAEQKSGPDGADASRCGKRAAVWGEACEDEGKARDCTLLYTVAASACSAARL